MRLTSRVSPNAFLFASVFSLALADSVPAKAHADFIRRTSLDAMVHWEATRVRMPVDPELEARFGPNVRALLAEAAQAWDVGGAVPAIELVHEVTPADRQLAQQETGNWIGFADEWTFGDKLAVTVSTYDVDTGALAAAQVWINPNRKFDLESDDGPFAAEDSYDLQGVLTHEIGHVLGLGEADEAPDATMFPTFKRGETRQRTLSLTDEQAVDELYSEAYVGPAGAAECATRAPGARPSAGPSLLMLALASCVVRRPLRRLRASLLQ